MVSYSWLAIIIAIVDVKIAPPVPVTARLYINYLLVDGRFEKTTSASCRVDSSTVALGVPEAVIKCNLCKGIRTYHSYNLFTPLYTLHDSLDTPTTPAVCRGTLCALKDLLMQTDANKMAAFQQLQLHCFFTQITSH